MAPGVPARVALVCTLLWGVAIARAERRPVAVIDLSGDPKAELAKALNAELINHPDLRPIPDPAVVPELFGEFLDDDARRITDAETAKQASEEQLARFSFEVAQQIAFNGLRELMQATPSRAALVVHAQLRFLRGQAMLGIPSRAAEARTELALAHRLDPTFVPDPARYLPDVVQAFEAAKQAWTGKGTLAVAGSGRLWIDGKETGVAPAELEVEAGPHVVWLTGADRVTTARLVTVPTGGKEKLDIPNAPADARLKVRRARAQLRYAPDAAARAAAMRLIAELVGVRDAVLLTTVNGKVIVQTWNAGTRDQAPGFSALRELGNEKPIDLLAPLAPPKQRDIEDPDPPIVPRKPIVDDRRWYERRTVQAGMVAVALGLIVGGYYLYNAMTDDSFLVNEDTQWGTRVSPLGGRW